jgi:signal transduction histidine kinase
MKRTLSLAQRLALAFLGLVAAVLVVNGSISMWFAYREATEAAVRVEQEKADAAAERVGQFIAELEQQIGWTTRADWARVPIEQRRYDFIRLLRQAPAITEALYVDGQGREQLRLSRLEPDVLDSGADLSADARFRGTREGRVWYGPVTFRRGSEPYMALAMAHAGRNPGATIAEVNLKLIWEVITGIRVGGSGYAFVTDTAGRLIAHPDMSLVLRETDLSALPQVADAIAGRDERVRTARTLSGQSVLSAHATIPRLGWIVFVEQPTSEALAPVYATAYQTLALLGLGVVLALLAGVVLARRLTGPIRALQAGAERLGQGDLAQRIEVSAGDEIGTLALRFNEMAGRIQDAQETLEAKVEERTADLNESLAQQTATSDVLKAISRSAFDLPAVLDTLARSAAELCEAGIATIRIRDGEAYPLAAAVGLTPDQMEQMRTYSPKAGTAAAFGRALLEGRTSHVPDLLGDPEIRAARPFVIHKLGVRSVLSIPLLRDGVAIGALTLMRTAPYAFTPKQIELAETFTDQAVIAIENTRLLEEVQARTKDLQASLEDLRAAQDRLVQTEKLASLGQLTAGIAHEIKNPLNFVNNFAELSVELLAELRAAMQQAGLDPALRAELEELCATLSDNLAKVTAHGKRADSIVRNMLAHSREGGGERRRVDVNALLEETLGLAWHGARAEHPGFNVTIEKRLDANVGELDLFPQEFARVLLNLFGNAFHAVQQKHTPGFQPHLLVATHATPASVAVTIRDNGTGIPEAVRSHIFEPFFTTKPPGQGTGLGLSLSHDIVVQQHGGQITVATEPGAWTEFTITLPRRPQPQDRAA